MAYAFKTEHHIVIQTRITYFNSVKKRAEWNPDDDIWIPNEYAICYMQGTVGKPGMEVIKIRDERNGRYYKIKGGLQ